MKRKNRIFVVLASFLGVAAVVCLVLSILNPSKSGSGAEDALLIYSPHPQEMTEYITREFRQRTGIKVEVLSGGTGDLIEKLKRHEGDGQADLFWGGGVDSLETIKDQFQEYRSPEASAILGSYTSPNNLWSPFSVLPIVIIYNTKLVSGPLVPASWTNLLNPYFRDHIIIADPVVSGSAYTILVTMLRAMSDGGSGRADAWPYVEKFLSQLGRGGVVPGSTTAYNAVAEGEFFAGITFENTALSLQKAGKEIGYRYPSEGTSAVPDGIALLKGAPHLKEAERFIDFVLGTDVQSILMSRWFRRSVRNDVAAYEPDLTKLKVIDYRTSESSALKSDILSRWSALRSRSRP